MTALDQLLLRLVGRSLPLRRALQRWALRYAARMLRSLGPTHEASADILQVIGETPPAAARSVTRTGIPLPARRPAGTPRPRPVLPQLHRDADPTRPYLAEDEPD